MRPGELMNEPKWIFDLVQSIGGQWLTVVFVIAWVVYKTRVVPHLFGVKNSERALLSLDQQRLVDNLQATVKALDLRLTEERLECEREMARIRHECDTEMTKLRQSISSMARGEERWRHLTGNLAQYVAALQAILRRASIEVPQFSGWDKFLAEGGEPFVNIE